GAENSLPGTPQTAKTSAEKSMMANNSQRKTAKNKKISVFPQPVKPLRHQGLKPWDGGTVIRHG
ncbi:MAG TPA: hypothetical protein VGX94_07395, partial [Terriglobia bacterium]|nr:hypothetical protein [Terriglobia bacterium]